MKNEELNSLISDSIESGDIISWDILEYLRFKQNWMVQSHYDREDIEEIFDLKFESDDEWQNFTCFACDGFDTVKEVTMNAIVECWKQRIN
jgi:hypothetical protein